ncbi:TolC family protein [uncultured Helicobacter sp.]|uniref:TolC family protein n=4 Tax=uncultured Helicobacter sp. TaxID=175537 RepID=UPI0025D7DB50|nr:TolC family protein [uncultured Helicobacter sp.]
MKGIILLLTLCSMLIAQEDSSYATQKEVSVAETESTHIVGGVFSLAELLEGAKRNYNLEAKDLAILQAQATNAAAYTEFLPTVDGAYQYQDTDNSYMRLKANTGSIKGNWEVFSGLKTYHKVREKASLYRASLEDKESTKDQLFLSIIEQYYGYFTNRAKLVSLEQKRVQLQSNVKRVERLFNAGLTTVDDVESLRAEFLATEHELANVRLEAEKNKLMLSLLANVEVGDLERKTIKAPLFKLEENRHDLNMLGFQADSAKYQARQITYLPIISISDTYVSNGGVDAAFKGLGAAEAAQYGSIITRQYPPKQNQIMINATIHLDFLTTYKQYQAARLGYLKNLKELAYKKEEQKKDEKLYRKSLEIAVAKIKASEAALRSASIAFENVAKKYDAQILNFTDYLQSLTTKVEAEATYNQALNDYEMQKAYYIYYSGQDLQEHIQ